MIPKKKAKKIRCKRNFVERFRRRVCQRFCIPNVRANAVYEGYYLLGTSIARPLIAKKQLEVEKGWSKFVSHGSTGKGNDQIRFELGYYAINPKCCSSLEKNGI